MLLWYKSFSSQVQELRILGTKALVFHRLPIPKRLFPYTQTIVSLYTNDRSPIPKLKRLNI